MREVAFIRQNKEKWLEVEQIVSGKMNKNPDDLSSLYINLVNDLSFARTYYPKSKTTVYLNHLSALVFQKIYKTKRIEENRFWFFYKTEVPLLLYEYRKVIYSAIIFFILFSVIGVFSGIYDQDFANLILGEEYVDMTIENIKNGNPIKVYDSDSDLESAMVIILNNIKVGAIMYISGVFGGLGSLYTLMNNSIMVGVFQYFFCEYDALADSARGIWLHGTYEIFTMIVEAGAGLILGCSVLFPKTFSRLESFKRGCVSSFKIYISTIPFTFVAGLIEGFITKHALSMPLWLGMGMILFCLLTIGFYYLVYPYIVNKKINRNEII